METDRESDCVRPVSDPKDSGEFFFSGSADLTTFARAKVRTVKKFWRFFESGEPPRLFATNRGSGPYARRYALFTLVDSRRPRRSSGSSGQGNRVKESCGEEACEEVVVPGGGLASEAQ